MERSIPEITAFIRDCVEAAETGDDTRLEIRKHFRIRMRERGIFWADVVPILLSPEDVTDRGLDDEERQQVWVHGTIVGIGRTRIVCSLDWDTRLITLNWEKP